MTDHGFHHHEFTPHVDRTKGCIVCGRVRVWSWHHGPFAPYRVLQKLRAMVRP